MLMLPGLVVTMFDVMINRFMHRAYTLPSVVCPNPLTFFFVALCSVPGVEVLTWFD